MDTFLLIDTFLLMETFQFMETSLIILMVLSQFQGNGHERDFMEDERVYILDVYNRHIYPHDGFAKSKSFTSFPP